MLIHNFYKVFKVKPASRFLFKTLLEFSSDKGLISLPEAIFYFNPYKLEESEARVCLRDLLENGLILVGKYKNKKDYYIRIVPWFGNYPRIVDGFKVIKGDHLEQIPKDFLKENYYRPSQYAPIKQARMRIKTTNDIKEDIKEIFEYWKEITGHSKAKLLDKRKTIIKKGLRQYTKQQFFSGIRGWQYSDWHQGDNPNGVVYDRLKHIVKNMETFIQLDDKN